MVLPLMNIDRIGTWRRFHHNPKLPKYHGGLNLNQQRWRYIGDINIYIY